MTGIYRVKINEDAHQGDVGRMVLNRDGTGFIILRELLPGMILYVEPQRNRAVRKTDKTDNEADR